MDIGKLRLFSALKEKMDWLGQRQRVLSQSVANANTPDYKPKDLKPLNFDAVLRSADLAHDRKLTPTLTSQAHLTPNANAVEFKNSRKKDYREIHLSGNAVTVEDQMLKVSQTREDHVLTTQLYKKYTGFFKMVLKP
ncbi:MAG: flagellar basal body rod protein FlgB [Holosporales bacterium]|jgi:flagellar basal-body rod protein FlgB